MKTLVKHIITLALPLLLAGCSHAPQNVRQDNSIPKIFPDYVGVTIPAGIAPLNFNYDGPSESIFVEARGSKGGSIEAEGDYADFDIDQWHELTNLNKGGKIIFTVNVKQNGEWTRYKSFDVNVSADPIGEWGLTYRLVAPGYEVYGKMGLYQRELATFRQQAIIENTSVPGACMNCHTPNRTNPDNFTFHVRGSNGGTIIGGRDGLKILNAKNDSLKGSLVYPYWHPSGRFIAYSTNKTHQSFHAVRSERIEVFDQASDILILNPTTNEIVLNPSVMTPENYENYPVFSPDGRTLYFVASVAWDIPANYKRIRYNLCKVGFDARTGRTIGQPDTIFNARLMGKSATHPRPSYDGRFIIFTMADYGVFPIWHNEADQWLFDIRTGKARPLTEINSRAADSFHNWSSNSRWLVFTSRRIDGYYTRLYLTHVNSDGTMSKPFLLPQKNPWEFYDRSLFSFNTPDFASRPFNLKSRDFVRAIVSPERIETKIR